MMQKRIDFSKTYAIALAGGGAKGGYEVGVWRSLSEEGLKYNAVSGTSVGALNGAMMTMRDLEKAEELWRNMRYSRVMNVDDAAMAKLFSGEPTMRQIGAALKKAVNIFKDGGFDISPLRELIRTTADIPGIKNSDVELFIVTYSLTDKKGLDIAVKSLPDDEICDMLLASAYYPAFRNEPLTGGKHYADGGFAENLPLSPLIDHGYKNIIAVRLTEPKGRTKKLKLTSDVMIDVIAPKRKLGHTLNFCREQSAFDMTLGYFDAKRYVYGLVGDYYYLERTLSEKEAYNRLMTLLEDYFARTKPSASLRTIHEELIPKFAQKQEAEGDYYDILIKYVEHTGAVFKIPEFRIMKDTDLISEVSAAMEAHGMIQQK
ncbi:MAG: patatin-like phospholipase family protein [Clostridia bacterium]|nr:patatin-like phospholipase family protein [Clostridia bacterium]